MQSLREPPSGPSQNNDAAAEGRGGAKHIER
jgi:hypothetical protein